MQNIGHHNGAQRICGKGESSGVNHYSRARTEENVRSDQTRNELRAKAGAGTQFQHIAFAGRQGCGQQRVPLDVNRFKERLGGDHLPSKFSGSRIIEIQRCSERMGQQAATEPIGAPVGVNVPSLPMAGFQLTLHGRIWVTPESRSTYLHGSIWNARRLPTPGDGTGPHVSAQERASPNSRRSCFEVPLQS